MAIDFHNHLIPGVDDGAQSVEEALDAIERFRRDGVNVIIATPHLDASLTLEPSALEGRLADIDEGWGALTAAAGRRFPDVTLRRGCELALDVPEPDLSDPRLRLDGGRFFLMEFPLMTVPPQAARVIGSLRQTGYVPIIAHPERYCGLSSSDMPRQWRQAGAHLQINGGSLLGRYGAGARRLAFELLALGIVDYICSDYHARGEPLTREYEMLLIKLGAGEQAHTLMHTNPGRVIDDLNPLPVTPLAGKRTLWKRVAGIFR
ncbi:MAG: tyrosine-protein phosphatase [Gemmatimonadota bacterium]